MSSPEPPPERDARLDVQRVLLVDDHALFREGMARLLAYEDDFEVIGQAADGTAALAAARELMPDVVLMDIDMPGGGLAATRRLTQEMPYVKVVVLTVHEDDDTLFEAVKAGAQGYLVKSIRSSELLELLRGMSRGEAPISRAMATRILQEFARTGSGAEGESGDAAEVPSTLTPRERDVLELVARRYSNKEIADSLIISEYTVKNHLRNILSKLHLRSRAEAARFAHDQGLVTPAAAVVPEAPATRSASGLSGGLQRWGRRG